MNYVLITAARNEQTHIARIIEAVAAQSLLPLRWLIVSDGSTDDTNSIVQEYQRRFQFIELIEISGDAERNFGSKAKAVNFGYDRLRRLEFDYVGNLDADIAFDRDYYKSIILEFEADKRLGIAGGIRYDLFKGEFVRVHCSKNSVGGPFQLFRRDCFEAIGCYRTLRYGGVDTVAEISARMLGWKVVSFPDRVVHHYRTTGSAALGSRAYNFRNGIKSYLIGYHPVFQFLRLLRTTRETGELLNTALTLLGYAWAFLANYSRPVSKEFVRFLRAEQRARLKHILLTGSDPLY